MFAWFGTSPVRAVFASRHGDNQVETCGMARDGMLVKAAMNCP
jgi:hypothetical protein